MALEDKMYYSIKEVAENFNLNASTLRYWESVFAEIKPRKNSNGVRFYTKQDIEIISLIYHLTKEKGLTLEGAQKRLRENRDATVRNHQLIEKLKQIRAEILAIRDEL